MNLALEVSQISHYYHDNLVLNDISFDVNKGEVFGFVGLNGAGKTTLIKIILDLLTQDSGEVRIFGQNKILPSSRSDLFYLPEKFQPSNNLKGIEFIKFALEFYNQKIDEKSVEEICSRFNFPFEKLKLKTTSYSKGMVQKLGLMSVFLSQAKFIILDEPMSGLDPKARISLKRELLEYKKKGCTIFLSSHILSDIDEICDNIAVLNEKEIVFLGNSEDLKKKHQKTSLDEAFLSQIGEI